MLFHNDIRSYNVIFYNIIILSNINILFRDYGIPKTKKNILEYMLRLYNNIFNNQVYYSIKNMEKNRRF